MDLLKQKGARPRKAWLLDTFDGFTYDEAINSADVIWANTHKVLGVKKTMERVTNLLHDKAHVETPFELVESNICADALPSDIRAISVANVDVDMYDATKAALEKVAPLIATGGIIICEDPTATPGLYGAYLAMNEFLATPLGKNFMSLFKTGGYFLINKH